MLSNQSTSKARATTRSKTRNIVSLGCICMTDAQPCQKHLRSTLSTTQLPSANISHRRFNADSGSASLRARHSANTRQLICERHCTNTPCEPFLAASPEHKPSLNDSSTIASGLKTTKTIPSENTWADEVGIANEYGLLFLAAGGGAESPTQLPTVRAQPDGQ